MVAGSLPAAQRGELFLFSLDASAARVQELARLLSEDEQARARRFRFEMHRSRYQVARGRLRELLGARLGVAPDAVGFDYGEHGKPALGATQARSGIRFNVSHSGNWCLAALTDEVEIGVDIEAWRVIHDELRLAARYFAQREVDEYLNLETSRRSEGFFNCWSRKEAYLKAVGQGLTLALDSFEVSLTPGEPAFIRKPSDRLVNDRQWCMAAVAPLARASAAIVVAGDACHIEAVDTVAGDNNTDA